eukprot:864280-Rhodomonas_salina.1
MDDVIAIEVEARLSLSAEEACLPLTSLRELCSERLEAAFEQHASKVERVECVSVTVENANCGGTRRSAAAPVAVVDAVIALADTPDAFVDLEAVVASGRVLAMKQTAGNKVRPSSNTTPAAGQVEAPGASGEDDNNVASSNTTVIGAAAGAAAGVVLLALVAWLASTKCRAPADPLMVSAGVVAQGPGLMDKVAIEGLLFGDGAVGAQAGPGRADSQKRLLEQSQCPCVVLTRQRTLVVQGATVCKVVRATLCEVVIRLLLPEAGDDPNTDMRSTPSQEQVTALSFSRCSSLGGSRQPHSFHVN